MARAIKSEEDFVPGGIGGAEFLWGYAEGISGKLFG
jgi:hypothetical protein